MASSDTIELSTATPIVESGSDVWSRRVFVFALVVPWWLPVLAQTTATIYKELVALLLVGVAGVIATWTGQRRGDFRSSPHPLELAALAVGLALALQAMLFDGVWRKAALAAAGVLLFFVSLRLSAHLRMRFGERTFEWLAGATAIAALGSCVFAALQLLGFDAATAFVVERVGNRLYGNVAQANQFADLLWVGAIGIVWLAATRRIATAIAAFLVLVLVFFTVTSGSRTVWLYVAAALVLGVAAWRRGADDTVRRRMAVGLVVLAVAQVAVSTLVLTTDALAPLRIETAERRSGQAETEESTRLRLWFWRSGLAAASEHPWLGVGAGRLAGAAREHVLATPDAPVNGADAYAHNLFVQLAAELGIPVALVVLAGTAWWLVLAWRGEPFAAATLAAIAMSSVMLIHTNLEHPFAYLYVLALFGAIAGYISMPVGRSTAARDAASPPSQRMRVAAFALVIAAILGYASFMPVERATQVLTRQVAAGKPPHPDRELVARLDAVQAWSPFADYAEALGVMASIPTKATAALLADRCEQAVAYAPTPYLLARCAADLQVAGRAQGAADFARSLCRIYPEAEDVLRQSTQFVASATPLAATLASSCPARP